MMSRDPQDPQATRRVGRARAGHHWTALAGTLVVLAAAALLNVQGTQSVSLPLVEVTIPELCTWRRWSGLDCPGCGLTRSFISLAHGRLRDAWQFNPAGVLLFGLLVMQIPYRGVQLWRLRQGQPPWHPPRLEWLACALFASLLLQWIYKMVA